MIFTNNGTQGASYKQFLCQCRGFRQMNKSHSTQGKSGCVLCPPNIMNRAGHPRCGNFNKTSQEASGLPSQFPIRVAMWGRAGLSWQLLMLQLTNLGAECPSWNPWSLLQEGQLDGQSTLTTTVMFTAELVISLKPCEDKPQRVSLPFHNCVPSGLLQRIRRVLIEAGRMADSNATRVECTLQGELALY